MKILIDDQRSILPDGTLPDVIIRTFTAANNVVLGLGFAYDNPQGLGGMELYLDHDLGEEKTGYDFICNLERELYSISDMGTDLYLPEKIVCVSDNPAGRKRIQQVIDKLYKRI